jgi:type IV pilus assembly protein PilE
MPPLRPDQHDCLRHRSQDGRNTGFTLIELLIALCIIGLMALLAYPQYGNAVRKARRTEAASALLRAMQQQEQHYSQHNRYFAYQGAVPEKDGNFIWFSGDRAATSAYQISASACAGASIAHCVELSASAGSALVDSRFQDALCAPLTLNSRGERSAAGLPLASAPDGCR